MFFLRIRLAVVESMFEGGFDDGDEVDGLDGLTMVTRRLCFEPATVESAGMAPIGRCFSDGALDMIEGKKCIIDTKPRIRRNFARKDTAKRSSRRSSELGAKRKSCPIYRLKGQPRRMHQPNPSSILRCPKRHYHSDKASAKTNVLLRAPGLRSVLAIRKSSPL